MRSQEYQLLKEAWGNWLSYNWEWEWWVSLTFRNDVGRSKANSLWWKWYGQLVKETGKDVQFVRTTELQRGRGWAGITHYHALMLNLKHVRRLSWLDRWVDMAGWARIYSYNSKLGASYYLCKYIVKEMGEVVFSDNLQEYTRFSDRPEQLEFLK